MVRQAHQKKRIEEIDGIERKIEKRLNRLKTNLTEYAVPDSVKYIIGITNKDDNGF